MYNFIQIKRRLLGQNINGGVPGLSSGELAYNENSNELYFGHTNGTVTIAGSGSYLKLDGNQTVNGNKTFNGLTTLSSTTFSASSLINAGGNKITNLGAPSLSADAATKKYVDDVASGASSNTTSLSTEIYDTFVKLTEERPVTLLSSINIGSDASVGGNLTVSGDLTVLGELTQMNTNVTTTSAFDITNTGSGPALEVTQTGNQAVAVFYDDANPALYIDGKTATAGNVGIGTDTPNERLTVIGNISATGNITAVSGDLTGTLEVDGASTLRGAISAQNTLTVDGATTLKNTLAVVGASTLTGIVSAQNNLSVVGATVLASTVTVSGTSTLVDDVTVSQGNLSVSLGNLTVDEGNVNVNVGNLIGGVSNYIQDFIIDGGIF